jgi:hypothetical protein
MAGSGPEAGRAGWTACRRASPSRDPGSGGGARRPRPCAAAGARPGKGASRRGFCRSPPGVFAGPLSAAVPRNLSGRTLRPRTDSLTDPDDPDLARQLPDPPFREGSRAGTGRKARQPRRGGIRRAVCGSVPGARACPGRASRPGGEGGGGDRPRPSREADPAGAPYAPPRGMPVTLSGSGKAPAPGNPAAPAATGKRTYPTAVSGRL